MESRKEKIEGIINEKYSSREQQLNLSTAHQLDNFSEYWSDVLLYRDWSMLKILWLCYCGITDDTISTFVNLKWPLLANLYLYENKLTSRGMQLILNCSLKNIKQLYLRNNFIGNDGVKYLVKSNLPYLETLGVGECRIGSEGIKHLVKSRWPNLKILWLGLHQDRNENKMRLSSWEIIPQFQFPQLKKLCVRQTQSICWMDCVLVQRKEAKINKNGIEIKNENLRYQIKAIMQNMNVLEE